MYCVSLFRADDFNDPNRLERTSTLRTFIVNDLGAFTAGSLSSDYTSEYYKINEWYVLHEEFFF